MRYFYKRKLLVFIMSVLIVLLMCSCGERFEVAPDMMIERDSPAESLIVGNSGSRITDVVLVMDESGSMVHADEERLAIEGAKLFIGMEKTSGSGIALVEFADKIDSTGLISIREPQDKDYIKNILNEVQYSRTAHTDTGAGLLEAISILDGAPEEDNKVILLFTDGNTDIDVGTPGRTTEDSLSDVEAAIQLAEQNNYRIYVIGLNADGKVDEQALADMADRTGGQYKIATNVNELPDFFNGIFADIDQSVKQELASYTADGDYYNVAFTIENSSVMEANIAILSSNQVESIILTNPSGVPVDLEGDDNVFFERSAKYSLTKLYYPQSGEWNLSVKGINGDNIQVELIYNYDMNLAVEVADTSVAKNENIKLAAYLVSQDAKVEDSAIYRGLTGTVFITDTATGIVSMEELAVSEDGTELTASLPSDKCAIYKLKVHVEGNGFYRDSEEIQVEVYKNPPVALKEEDEILTMLVNQTAEVDLNNYFSDDNGDKITYSLSASTGVACELQESRLTFTPLEAGTYTASVYAENGADSNACQKFVIVSETFLQRYGKWFLAAIVVAVAVLLWYLIQKSGERIYGAFMVRLVMGSKDENGVSDEKSYSIRQIITAEQVGKKGFTIATLISLLPQYYGDPDKDKREALSDCVNQVRAEAAKIKIRGSRKPYVILLQNRSDSAKLLLLNNVSGKKKALVSLEDKKTGVTNVMEKEFGVRFSLSESDYCQISVKYKRM